MPLRDVAVGLFLWQHGGPGQKEPPPGSQAKDPNDIQYFFVVPSLKIHSDDCLDLKASH